MTHWDDIRRHASERHAELAGGQKGLVPAAALLAAAERVTGVTRVPLPAADPLLYGGQAALYEGMLFYNADAPAWRTLFSQAHEYAHHWLAHGHSGECSADDVELEPADEGTPTGAAQVGGYGPRERREREANAFALEFLLPRERLRRWYLDERKSVEQIAATTGAPRAVVLRQLPGALLIPPMLPARLEQEEAQVELDASQAAAAYAERGPLLIEAGPGTGKTRTLVARILHLLERGTPPGAILALTFSNKAAEEMRSRVALVAPQSAPLIWIGTFHAFGLELLHKFGGHLGLPPVPRVIDPIDALLLLERALPELELVYYENLYEPATYLRDMLAAISRAKDELAGPERYAALADAMLAEAQTGEEREAAERAVEVARVYRFYQEQIERRHLLDYGDLIRRAVELLRRHPEVRAAVRRSYREILVDEYQDVNRASAVLLREVAGDGGGLWVVGDPRQAIYRFRGAAPENMRLFAAQDFPGATVLRLAVNYRSRPAIVGALAAVAPQMSATAGEPFEPWRVERGEQPGEVRYEIAADAEAEAEGIAAAILERHAAGVPSGEQAVLCRSHGALARIGARLERHGIPLLYLGNLFERPEIRDLLSLLALAAGDADALVRVATFAEYRLPAADVRRLLPLLRARHQDLLDSLDAAADDEELSQSGRAGLRRLAGHLAALSGETSIWRFLARYLFEIGGFLPPILAGSSPAAGQQRLSIYQLLLFTRQQEGRAQEGALSKGGFLRYIRRLELFGEDRQVRQVPGWAEDVDAVRMLTVHAAKGLEFGVVYLPGLGRGYFPARPQPEPCPPPRGMLAGDPARIREEEEECLFFVALSRARDTLVLSRARFYGAARSNPSPLLDKIAALLPLAPDGEVTWDRSEPPRTREEPPPPEVLPRYPVQALELYMECPRRFYYEEVAGLSDKREDLAYYRFHLCVGRALDWIRDEQAEGRAVGPGAALEMLARLWRADGPVGHEHESIYLRWAEVMVARAATSAPDQRSEPLRRGWEVELAYGRVSFVPDDARLATSDDGSAEVVLERRRTGRPTAGEHDRDIYALYQAAAAKHYPGATTKVTVSYPGAGEREEVRLSDRKLQTRLQRYNQALSGIQEGRFNPTPGERTCPRCPFYFICPSG